MRLVIAGGGTGGHVSPALAIAQAFRAELPDAQVLLVGRRGGPEERLVPQAGFSLRTVQVQGFDRDNWVHNARLVVLPHAFHEGTRILREFQPSVVVGVGGYVMAPALWGAQRTHTPYVLQVSEADGLANRLFRRGADAACVTFASDVDRFVTHHTVLTGYPLRPGFVPRTPEVPPRRLLVVGGSQGSHRINEAVWGAIDGLLDRFGEVVHLTGRQGEEKSATLLRPRYRPIAFSDRMPQLLGEADLVLCRAGVGTIAEVTAVGLPMVVVPGPFGGAHQSRNGARVEREGAAVQIADQELTPERLLQEIDRLTPERLREMALRSRALGRPDAAAAIVRVLREAAERTEAA
ncbi:MAG: UDP-N-acetylglucosamine--N-acetylmuramyl-(pentapeptide) pyrophosphoryl-undecaprenol N-acetylglucosamine transferase [Candidatus Dormibacteraeota bacterium]|nr:UDP-N-acetylglucosamine--N-acetylmuramyl-(pentapeptide) pyrophosphoryl-undecaprenol N-acetylglucosamine transferase [Candidatus Dormibacteraeota bacterium]MBO0746579.1 UDP-N-acetylglucosamine--N-acetylmuramyl-(pentapeptide) pyrophosphoryl-undecaprenol N-acetylglucosamine transferase [Candidatus Dormibacteraeota bacterium]